MITKEDRKVALFLKASEKADIKLVEKFMGYENNELISKVATADGVYIILDWNDIMPVVEKIEGLHNGVFHFFIVQKEADIALDTKHKENGDDWDVPRIKSISKTKIEATWEVVIKFIKWYNNSQPLKQ